MLPPTERFSDRVEDYVRYRPSYPAEAIRFLAEVAGLGPGCRVADVGCGTGIFAALLLEAGAEVWGVEPNGPMREAAVARFGAEPRFHPVAGTAESTALGDGSVDLVTAAQAFHWFRREEARAEFARILRPGGQVAVVWNGRSRGGDPFMADYEAAVDRYSPEYRSVSGRDVDDADLVAFIGPGVRRWTGPNHQDLDLPGLIGRAMSSSYAPKQGAPGHDGFVAALERAFADHAVDGRVRLLYETKVAVGKLA